MTVLWF